MAKKVNLLNKKTPSKKYLYKSKNGTIIFVSSLFALLVILGCVVAFTLSHNQKIDTAKKQINEFDNQLRVLDVLVNPNADDDNDSLINSEEKTLKTDYLSADTDGDGLSDGDEVIIKTDPIIADTDGDGLIDSVEVFAGINPLEKETNGTPDNEKKFTVNKSVGEISADFKGRATVYNAIVNEVSLTGFSANSSIVSNAYEIYCSDTFDECAISFNIEKNNVVDEVSVFKFNLFDGSYSKIESVYNKNNKTVTATIYDNGMYMLANSNTIHQETKTRVHFLIDNSGSMYSQDIIPNSPENDIYFKRLDFVKQLIEKFDDTYSVAISRFTKDYHYMQEFTNDKKRLKDVLNSIKTLDEDFNGTYIQYSLEECMKSFVECEEKTVNIIILVTDGDTTEETPPDTDYISKLAKDNNVIILTVSIGNNIDKNILSEIAFKTDGKYYSASDANLLTQIYSQIVSTLNYDKADIQSSLSYSTIGYMMYNTGFLPSENGFGFVDYRTYNNNSVSFGMCLFARNWFSGKMINSMSDTKNGQYKIKGFNLKDTEFETYYSVHKKLRSVSLIGVSTSKYLDPTKYLDFEHSNNNVLEVDEEIRIDAMKKGWNFKNFKLDNKILDWETVNLLVLDVENNCDDIELTYGKSEAEFYKAINRLNVEMYKENSFVNLSSGNEGFDTICNKLKNGEPVIVLVNGNYAMLGTALVKNATNPTEYVLKVYDPSAKDVVKELYIKKTEGCSVNNSGTVDEKNNYYKAIYNSKDVSILVYKN